MEDSVTDTGINIICTNRGRHTRCMIRAHARKDDLPADGRDVHTFRCTRCRRAPQIRLDRWPGLVDQWTTEGRAEVDISLQMH